MKLHNILEGLTPAPLSEARTRTEYGTATWSVIYVDKSTNEEEEIDIRYHFDCEVEKDPYGTGDSPTSITCEPTKVTDMFDKAIPKEAEEAAWKEYEENQSKILDRVELDV